MLRLASGKRRGRLQWPDQYLQQSLTRDGDHPVIDYLSFLATAAMLENQKRYGLTAQEVAISCRDWMLGPFPFSATAWKRATDLVLHRIDNRPIPPADWFDDDIEAVDLAGALLTLHVIALMRLCARQTGPLARAGGHLPPRSPRPPRSL